MALIDSLVSYWKLDESSDGSGAVTRVDSHGSNDLTDNNTTPSGTGIINNGSDHEVANSEYLSRADADAASLKPGDADFSIAAWLKFESLTNLTQNLVAKYAEGGNQRSYALRLEGTTDKPGFALSNNGIGVDQAVWGSALVINIQYFIVGTYDATANEIGVSVNDETPVTAAHAGGAVDSTAAFMLGAQQTINFLDGILDEVSFWDKALSSAERTQLYNAGNGLAYPLVVGAKRAAMFFSKMHDFYRDLKLGLLPPDQLQRRYRELVAI